MDISNNLQQSYNLYLKNFSLLFLASLVAGILSGITVGILAGPLFGGLLILSLKLLREEKTEINEIFAHFDKFLPTFLLVLGMAIIWFILKVISFIPVIGFLISLVAGPALPLIFIIALGLVVEQNKEPLPAVEQGLKIFLSEPLIIWVYCLLLGIIAFIGTLPGLIVGVIITPFLWLSGFLFASLLMLIGIAVTTPLSFLGLTIAYKELTTKDTSSIQIEKQTLQIAGIILGVLFVLGFLCMTVWGYNSRHFDPKVKITPGSQSFNINSKNPPVGNQLPGNFPKDITLYPHAKIGGYIGGTDGRISGSITTFETPDTVAQVATFYVTNMQSQGWTVTESDLGKIKMINCKKGVHSVSITLNPTDNKTDILISIAK